METIGSVATVGAAILASFAGALGVAWLCLRVVIHSMSRSGVIKKEFFFANDVLRATPLAVAPGRVAGPDEPRR